MTALSEKHDNNWIKQVIYLQKLYKKITISYSLYLNW